jgi:hypothetical protein
MGLRAVLWYSQRLSLCLANHLRAFPPHPSKRLALPQPISPHLSESPPLACHPALVKQLRSCEHRFKQQPGVGGLEPESHGGFIGCAWTRSGLDAETCSFDGGSQMRVFVPWPLLMIDAMEALRVRPVLASGEAFTR